MFNYNKVAEIFDVKDSAVIDCLLQHGYKIVDGNPEEGCVDCKTLWIVEENVNEDN